VKRLSRNLQARMQSEVFFGPKGDIGSKQRQAGVIKASQREVSA